MKKNKRNEALKQGIQPAAQALRDDDLMDVAGGTIFCRWVPCVAGGRCKQYGILRGDEVEWVGYDPAEALRAAGVKRGSPSDCRDYLELFERVDR